MADATTTNPLIERAVDRALELAAAAATGEWTDARAQAFGKATALAASALEVACVGAGGASPEHIQMLTQLSGVIQEMGARILSIEAQQKQEKEARFG